MSESDWTKLNGTLSHKNASKEFELTEQQIFDAIKQGKLQYRQNSAHGNPYFKLLRSEVEAFALDVHGGAEALHAIALKHQLKKINTEINSCKRKLSALEKQKLELNKLLVG